MIRSKASLRPFFALGQTLLSLAGRFMRELRVLRGMPSLSGSELSGDYNACSQSWDHTFKGVSAHLRGNGDTVNETTFTAGGLNYSILYHSGQEGQGLTLDEINSLINGMS